jgi:hypothetical protein
VAENPTSTPMNTALTQQLFSGLPTFKPLTKKDGFRERFQRSMRSCVKRGFSVEESFGMIWVETWEEIALSEREQAELYEEMLTWVKATYFEQFHPVIHDNYSPVFNVESAKPLPRYRE